MTIRVALLGLSIVVLSLDPLQAAVMNYACSFPRMVSPEGAKASSPPFEMQFTRDTLTKKAFVIGNAGMSEVTAIEHENGISFVEVTDSGNVMVTAITKTGEAVHSRNTIMQRLVPTQYYGTCPLK